MADKKITQLPASTVPLAGTEVLPIVQSGTTKQVSVADLTAGRATSATQFVSTIVTGTPPLVVSSTTEVANLKSATSTSTDAVKSNATTGLLQITGPADSSTRVMTTPDASFTVARTDAANSFTGNQTLSTGNLVIGTSGKGIDFSATPQPAGMTSELLTDYEEGTWTPSQGANLTVVGAFTSSGTYTKIGNVVQLVGIVGGSTSVAVSAAGLMCGSMPYTGTGTGSAGLMINDSVNSYGVVFTSGTNLYASSAIAATPTISFSVVYTV